VTAPPFLTSRLLAGVEGVSHGFFTRAGGVSRGLYDSLNVGIGSRDDPAAVRENRRRVADAFAVPADSLLTAYQTHSAVACVATQRWGPQRPEADAVVTDRPGLLCGALAADCAPVLIADGAARVVAAVHAGWRGAFTGVIASAVAAMVDLGAQRERMIAAVGPCIGPASYEVGEEFLERFEAQDPAHAQFFAAGATRDKRLFDLPNFVLSRLSAAGVGAGEWVGRDTFAEPQAFFSNRAAFRRGENDYGRMISVILIGNPAAI
jgi:YfiH family protein